MEETKISRQQPFNKIQVVLEDFSPFLYSFWAPIIKIAYLILKYVTRPKSDTALALIVRNWTFTNHQLKYGIVVEHIKIILPKIRNSTKQATPLS